MSPERTPLEAAREHLERVADRDPFYKPAAFTLAYAMLLQGDTDAARPLFASLTEFSNQQAKLRFESAKERWPRTSIRFHRFIARAKPIKRVLLPWVDHWLHVTVLLNGGTFYRLAREWTEFPDRLERFKRAQEQGLTFEQRSFKIHIDIFNQVPSIGNAVRIAAGLETGRFTVDQARRWLDRLLVIDEVETLDQKLSLLESKLALAQVKVVSYDVRVETGEEVDPAERLEPLDLKPLKETALVDSFDGFDKRLDELAESWKAEQWDRCKTLLHELRLTTRGPDHREAGALLERVSLFNAGAFRPPEAPPVMFPRLERWLVALHLPVYALLDSWRAGFGTGFVLESEYYLALADYMTYTSAGMCAALERATRLNTLLLVGEAPSTVDAARYEELRILAQCLEIETIVRILLGNKNDVNIKETRLAAEIRLDQLNANVIPELRTFANRGTASPHVVAAAWRVLGLLARYDPETRVRLTSTVNADERLTEFEYFSRSLTLARVPDTCFALAEHLLASDRRWEAKSHVEEALRLCPRHAGALALRAKLAGALIEPPPHEHEHEQGQVDDTNGES